MLAAPKVLGRTDDGFSEADARARTELVGRVFVPFSGAVEGETQVEVFRSTDEEDRGGIVLRITVEDRASAFVPHAKLLDNGIELHMAGDTEARTLVAALKAALNLAP